MNARDTPLRCSLAAALLISLTSGCADDSGDGGGAVGPPWGRYHYSLDNAAFNPLETQITPDNVLAKSKEYLADSGIDMAAWAGCAEDTTSSEYQAAAAVVDADMAFGQQLGVTGTPGFFVNGEFLNGAQPLSAFEPVIAKAKSAG